MVHGGKTSQQMHAFFAVWLLPLQAGAGPVLFHRLQRLLPGAGAGKVQEVYPLVMCVHSTDL